MIPGVALAQPQSKGFQSALARGLKPKGILFPQFRLKPDSSLFS